MSRGNSGASRNFNGGAPPTASATLLKECCRHDTTGKTLPLFRSYAKCPALPAKIFFFPKERNYDLKKPSRPDTEGRSANRHDTLGGMRWTLLVRRRCASEADGQDVWSCPLDAGVKFAEMISGRRWLKSPIRRGEHGAAEKNHRAGNAGSSGDLW
jgi:hypothetical protein